MIYNLFSYLKINLPDIVLIAGGLGINSPQECICVIDSGGAPDHDGLKTDHSVQILGRGLDSNKVRVRIYSVYNLLKNRFSLVLPEISVGDTIFPEVKTYQISPNQSPGYLGSDGSNLEMWSFNLIVTTA